jgi:hypothetical protein
MAHAFVGHVAIFVFVGAHPVGDGFQGVFHAHRPQGWALKKIHPFCCSRLQWAESIG